MTHTVEELGRARAICEVEAKKIGVSPETKLHWQLAAVELQRQQTEMLKESLARPAPLIPCAVEGCVNHCAGSRYCARCEEELNSQPYSLANLLHETFLDVVISAWKKLWHD